MHQPLDENPGVFTRVVTNTTWFDTMIGGQFQWSTSLWRDPVAGGPPRKVRSHRLYTLFKPNFEFSVKKEIYLTLQLWHPDSDRLFIPIFKSCIQSTLKQVITLLRSRILSWYTALCNMSELYRHEQISLIVLFRDFSH